MPRQLERSSKSKAVETSSLQVSPLLRLQLCLSSTDLPLVSLSLLKNGGSMSGYIVNVPTVSSCNQIELCLYFDWFAVVVSLLIRSLTQDQGCYNSTKAAVTHLGKSLAREWREFARVVSMIREEGRGEREKRGMSLDEIQLTFVSSLLVRLLTFASSLLVRFSEHRVSRIHRDCSRCSSCSSSWGIQNGCNGTSRSHERDQRYLSLFSERCKFVHDRKFDCHRWWIHFAIKMK